MTIADSLAYPFESDSKYPYTPDGNREFLDGKEIVEAFVLTAALGAGDDEAAVQLLRAQAAVRHPALTAKQASSLAALTGNRLDWAWDQPVARGLRADGRPIRKARQADGRMHRDRPRPHHRRVLRIPRRVLRHSQDQDDARRPPSRSRSWSAATPMRRCDARRAWTAGCTAAAVPRGTRRAHRQGQAVSGRKRAKPARSRFT